MLRAISGTTTEEYKANLKKIYTISTIQSFWAVFNHIPSANEMQVKIILKNVIFIGGFILKKFF